MAPWGITYNNNNKIILFKSWILKIHFFFDKNIYESQFLTLNLEWTTVFVIISFYDLFTASQMLLFTAYWKRKSELAILQYSSGLKVEEKSSKIFAVYYAI